MKKVCFFVILTMVYCANAFAALYCPGSTVSFQWLQDSDDDEFMYTHEDTFKEAQACEDDNGCELKKGFVYECDNEQGCGHYKYFLTTETSYFKGSKTGPNKLYQCVLNNSDEWQLRSYTACTTLPENYTDLSDKIVNLDGRDFTLITYGTNITCYLTPDMRDCLNAKKSDPKVKWDTVLNECSCRESNGQEYVWNKIQKKCVPSASSHKPAPNKDKPDPNKDIINPPADKKTCREQRTTTEGKACCDLPKEVAEWTGKECRCLVSGMKFVERNGRGYCEATQSDKTKPFECNTDTLDLIANWSTQCKDNADIMALIDKIQEMCRTNTKSEQDFNKLWGSLLELQPQNCTQTSNTDVTITITKLTERVNDAYSRLVSIHNKFRDEKSVWKDKDGNFNTARLASDSIAGVVLGTTGALVTSHVVKKNQVENGFEDIKCTIGGQNVSQWGDQFRVGIQ